MIKIENAEVVGMEHAIRGMRNPMNSWNRSDTIFVDRYGSYYTINDDEVEETRYVYPYCIGPNDADLMIRLNAGGPVHAKYRRMIGVYCDITAPLYWWKEFDTYKVGTVANSCSTMHKIHEKEFTIDDFSHDHIITDETRFELWSDGEYLHAASDILDDVISVLNHFRELYIKTKDKKYWWQMIQLLPSSYNQKRTVYLNYEVLVGMYKWRKNHKLDEWREFCKTMKQDLPYSWIFTGEEDTKTKD